MFNCILDGFPSEYRGYDINTDFKVGILLSLLTEDKQVREDLKLMQAFNLLYKEKVPDDIQLAYDGLIWFLSCGKSEIFYADEYIEEKSPDKCLDFNVDHMDIWGAFWAKGVDLRTAKMHWFAFMSAISNLGDCPLTQKMGYRATDLSKMKGDTRKYYEELKEKYKVRELITKEQHEINLKVMEEQAGSYYMKLREAAGGR